MKHTTVPSRLILLLTLFPLVILSACTGGSSEAESDLGVEESASAPGGDDLATVGDYELTMDKIDRFYDVHRNLALAMRDMTPDERERQDLAFDAGDDASLDEFAARIEGNEIMREAIEEAGLTAHEYAVLTMALLQAGMAAAVVEMQPDADPDSLMREMEVNPANVQFMREHGAELEAKQRELEAELEQMGVTE